VGVNEFTAKILELRVVIIPLLLLNIFYPISSYRLLSDRFMLAFVSQIVLLSENSRRTSVVKAEAQLFL
jgi:hypothetical protein